MRRHIVEGEPGSLPWPQWRLLIAIRGLLERLRDPGDRHPAPSYEAKYAVTIQPEYRFGDDRIRHVWVYPGGEENAPDPAKLRIDVGSDGSALLVHLDDTDEHLADSWHRSVDEAFDTAGREYGVPREDWADA